LLKAAAKGGKDKTQQLLLCQLKPMFWLLLLLLLLLLVLVLVPLVCGVCDLNRC